MNTKIIILRPARCQCCMAKQQCNYLLTQGAKNLRKMDFPSVAASKFSGVSSMAEAEEAAMARKRAACFIMVVLFLLVIILWLRAWLEWKIFVGFHSGLEDLACLVILWLSACLHGCRAGALICCKPRCKSTLESVICGFMPSKCNTSPLFLLIWISPFPRWNLIFDFGGG